MVYIDKEYKYSKIILKMILNYIILVLIALVAGHVASIRYKFFLGDDNEHYIFVISLLTIYYWVMTFRSKFILKLIIVKEEKRIEVFVEYIKYIFFRTRARFTIEMVDNCDHKAVQFDCREGVMTINNKLKLEFHSNRHCKEIREKIEALLNCG